MESLRVIVSGELAPDLNMGIDEALLFGEGPSTLRLYGWSPAAISIGRFQEASAFAGSQPVVRRLTGGGAIHHDRELTFALTCAADRMPGSIEASYRRVHDAIARALRGFGVATRPAGPQGATPGGRPGADWCFAEPSCVDLLTTDGRKILGSAQRRIRRPHARILHHGSLPLSAPSRTPQVGAVTDETSRSIDPRELAEAVGAEIAGALGLTPVPGELGKAELDRARALATASYPDLRESNGRTGTAPRSVHD